MHREMHADAKASANSTAASIAVSRPSTFSRLIDACAGALAQHWEIIADNLSKTGFSWGYVSAIDCNGRTIWIADAHRDDGKRFIVHADEKLIAF